MYKVYFITVSSSVAEPGKNGMFIYVALYTIHALYIKYTLKHSSLIPTKRYQV